MQFKILGHTELRVSELALGTVSLGMNYGIQAPGEFGRPGSADAIRLLHAAVEAGINLFDTAPAYGESEQLLGAVLGSYPHCYVATKVSLPTDANGKSLSGHSLKTAVQNSLHSSLKLLRRDVLDIVQIHNATVDCVTKGEIGELLLDAKRQGKIRYLGASVYGEDAALTVIESKQFEVLQVAYNLLDQRMAQRVFPTAERAGVGVVVRSPLLKGALTSRAQWLPVTLVKLKDAADTIRESFAASWQALPDIALRFCISAPGVVSTLVGASTLKELEQALAAAEMGPLSKPKLARTAALALSDERLLNPSYWPIA